MYQLPCCAFCPYEAQHSPGGPYSHNQLHRNGTWSTNTRIHRHQRPTHNSSKWRPANFVGFCPHNAPSRCAERCAITTGSSLHSWFVSPSREIPTQGELANTHANRKRLCPSPDTSPNSLERRQTPTSHPNASRMDHHGQACPNYAPTAHMPTSCLNRRPHCQAKTSTCLRPHRHAKTFTCLCLRPHCHA